jgi:hypothetical protein
MATLPAIRSRHTAPTARRQTDASRLTNPFNSFPESVDSNPLNPLPESVDSNPLNPFPESVDSNPFNPFPESVDSNPFRHRAGPNP